MSESYFSQPVSTHEAALVHVAVDAVDVSLAGVLPHGEVAPVGEHWLTAGVLGNHEFVVVDFALQVEIIEIGEGVEQWLLMICLLHKFEEFRERVAELFGLQSALGLDINHRQEVLIAWPALAFEVLQLGSLIYLWTIEMIRANLEPIFVGQFDILFVFAVDIVASFGGLKVHVGHLGVVAYRFPEHVALIMAQVDAVDVGAGILAFHLCLGHEREQNTCDYDGKNFHSHKITKKRIDYKIN